MSILTDLVPGSLAAKALIAVAVCGTLAGGGYYYGHKQEKAAFDDYVQTQKAAAEAQVIANQAALKKQSADFAAQVASIHSEYTDNAQHLQSARDAALASAASYSGELQRYLASPHVIRVTVPGAVASTNGVDAAGSGGLLDGVSSLNWYLTQRFSDADSNANTLNEAIALIAKDRAECNGSLPGVTPQ